MVVLPVVSRDVVAKLSYGDWLVGLIALGLIALKATDGKLHHIPNPEFHRWYSSPQEGQPTKPAGPKRTRNINIKMSEAVWPLLCVFLISGQRSSRILGYSIWHSKSPRQVSRKRSHCTSQYQIHGSGFSSLRS